MESSNSLKPFSWEDLNVKVRIGSLLFDILLDRTFEPGQFGPGQLVTTSPKHIHAAYEIQFIVSGSGTLFIEEKQEQVKAGTILIIIPHVFHTLRQKKQDPITRFTFRFTLQELPLSDPWFPQKETDQIKAILYKMTYCQIPNPPEARINVMLDEVRSEAARPTLGTYTVIQSLLMKVLIHITRSLPRHNAPYALSSKIKDDQRTQIIDVFFSKQYKYDLTIEMLAQQLNLSIKQVNRLLQKQYGVSFKQKLIDTRIEVAKILLQSNQLSIQQIAEEVNYTAPYFSHVFMLKTGMVPSQYRVLYKHKKY